MKLKRKNVILSKRNKGKRYADMNVGLHCHCKESVQCLIELLKKAKEENVFFLSINNYKSLDILKKVLPELSNSEINQFSDIKLIPAIEMPGSFNFTNTLGQNYNIEVHILGYGIELDKDQVLENFNKTKYKSLNQEEEMERLIKIGHELGLEFNDEDVYLDLDDDNRKFAGRAFMQALMKNMDKNFCFEGEDNKKKLPSELRENWRAFQNRCVKDPNSPFYLDIASLNPSVGEVIELIHQMGGKAYLAHPSAYFTKNGSKEDIKKAYDETIEFGKQFINQYSPKNLENNCIDGVEVYHPSYQGNIDVISKMKELAKYYRKATSGGTDIHVDKTMSEDETISGNSMNDRKIHISNLRKISFLTRKARSIQRIIKEVTRDNVFEK